VGVTLGPFDDLEFLDVLMEHVKVQDDWDSLRGYTSINHIEGDVDSVSTIPEFFRSGYRRS
jgi:hypothetical protein